MSGCEKDKGSEEYKAFVSKYGAASHYYCDKDTGFFMMEYYNYKRGEKRIQTIRNDLNQPTRCGNTEIAVIETSKGTNRW